MMLDIRVDHAGCRTNLERSHNKLQLTRSKCRARLVSTLHHSIVADFSEILKLHVLSKVECM